MFSICIPTFNYDVRQLVSSLYEQSLATGISFEILVVDDASTDRNLLESNRTIKKLEHAFLFELAENVGRSKIRNILAQKARYDWLLFLDCDVMPCDNNFVINYLKASVNTDVIVGGICYRDEFPGEDFRLRWEYGRERECCRASIRSQNPYRSFMTGNFFIERAIFSMLKFDESISQYGHEDTLFGIQLKSLDVVITHIDNPAFHEGLEKNEIFLAKTKQSVDTLKILMEAHPLRYEFPKYIRLANCYLWLKIFGFKCVMGYWFRRHEKILIANLCSDHPSLRMFDLFKLGYMCSRNAKKNQ